MDLLLTSSLAQASGSAPNQGLQVFFYIMMGLGVLIGVCMTALIFFTGKGDAMGGGGGSVRTTFKGKTSFDDQMYMVTLGMGIAFMVVMLVCDLILRALNP